MAGPTLKPQVSPLRWVLFFVGLVLLSFGINLMSISQSIGLSPWDSLFVSLWQNFGISIGFWIFIVNFTFTVTVFVLKRSNLTISSIVTMVLISLLVDGIGYLFLDALKPIPDLITFIIGTLSVGIGIGLYVATGVAIAPHEGFMLTISERFGWSYRITENLSSLVAVAISYLLHGPIFIGTLILSFLTGYIIQVTMDRSKKLIHRLEDVNYGTNSFN